MLRLSRTKTYVASLNQHLAVINLAIFTLILVVGFMYIIQVNRSTTKGYQIRDLETRIEQLGIENQRLEIEAAQNRSMAAIDTKVQMLNMKPVEKVEYVSASRPTVALNQ